jgi:hypothetical protein
MRLQAIHTRRKQAALYWAPGNPDGYGRPSYGGPVEIWVRWELTHEEFIDPDGTRKLSRVVVWLDQEVAIGGKLMLGTLDDLDSRLAPLSGRAWEVQQVTQHLNLAADREFWKAML